MDSFLLQLQEAMIKINSHYVSESFFGELY